MSYICWTLLLYINQLKKLLKLFIQYTVSTLNTFDMTVSILFFVLDMISFYRVWFKSSEIITSKGRNVRVVLAQGSYHWPGILAQTASWPATSPVRAWVIYYTAGIYSTRSIPRTAGISRGNRSNKTSFSPSVYRLHLFFFFLKWQIIVTINIHKYITIPRVKYKNIYVRRIASTLFCPSCTLCCVCIVPAGAGRPENQMASVLYYYVSIDCINVQQDLSWITVRLWCARTI